MNRPVSPYEPPGPSRDQVAHLFDRIASRYDLVNRVLSFRIDTGWRRKLAASLPATPRPLRVLDVATGTADVPIALTRHAGGALSGAGVDPSGGMLALGRHKLHKAGLLPAWDLIQGDARSLPFPDASFDAVTIAFGIRNVPDPIAGLREMRRVLRPNGLLVVLEFSMPVNPLFRPLYLLYFRHILPFIGGMISGNTAAYRYLNQTVESFPHGPAFLTLMEHAGFSGVSAQTLTMGIASLYRGTR